jgi:hypothetical protein
VNDQEANAIYTLAAVAIERAVNELHEKAWSCEQILRQALVKFKRMFIRARWYNLEEEDCRTVEDFEKARSGRVAPPNVFD